MARHGRAGPPGQTYRLCDVTKAVATAELIVTTGGTGFTGRDVITIPAFQLVPKGVSDPVPAVLGLEVTKLILFPLLFLYFGLSFHQMQKRSYVPSGHFY